MRKVKMITVNEFATAHSVTTDAVLKWIQAGKLPGVTQEKLPFSGGEKYIYLIPEGTPRPAKGKPGPTPKTATKKASKKGN